MSNGIFLLFRKRLTGLLLAVLTTGCATGAPGEIPGPILLERIRAGNPPVIVDVRSAAEYEAGHIPGAISIPFWAVLSRYDRVPATPDQPIVIYCEHGPRAVLAKPAFRLVGFREILYLEGDMQAWKTGNLPLEPAPVPP
ncbi:MAG: rhodanese-like domain-containing protein [Thermodesulfobacteriota bacterium]